ncbi:DNA polymerase III subunit alpha [bacterium]|nr:DNA polymerase III subunit alpha [bacterium]
MPHIDVSSWYSFHHGVASPEELCLEAANLGFKTLGICDRDGTYGLVAFYKAAIKYGLRPLLGLALTTPQTRLQAAGLAGADPPAASFSPADAAAEHSMGSLRLRDKTWHYADALRVSQPGVDAPLAIVLAKNREGYSELCALATGRQLEEHWDPVRALAAGTENCFVISDNEKLLSYLAPRLGPRRVFVRTLPDYAPAYRALQIRQLRMAARLRLQPVACTEVCFIKPQDQSLHHALRAIGQNTSLEQAEGVRPRSHYLAAPTELPGLYYDCPEALENAQRIAERCDVEIILGKWQFPDYELGRQRNPPQVLRELCQTGMTRRLGSRATEAHQAQVDMELKVIEELGYSSYFLFVYEIVREAFRRRIPFVGRGSAANSIVSYLLGLTPIDPLRYNMYFERFLNAERSSPPDIDIDFNWRRRDEILSFVYERWGHERVAMISTHQCFRARGALRELAKVYGLSNAEISQISRYMPSMNAAKLAGVVQTLPEMQGVDLSAEPYRQLLPLAARLGGRPRHLGIHCGGIVIAPGRLTHFTGLQRAAKGFVVTQYDMHPVEDIGLIKIDLLGNRSLGVLEDTVAVLRSRDIEPPVNSMEVLTRDPRIRQMLRTGNTMGCFYIESPAMRALLKRLRTETYLGLTAASSVIRPGVAESGMMQEYIRRSHNMPRKLPSHPLMDKLLPETHGVMVYQEDVIRVAHELAGMTPTQSDILRRGMSGKHRSPDEMNRLREVFIAGCEKNGLDNPSALEIWRQLSSFSGYSFCKAHSASFATLSYQVAWLKAYYPAEFMAAVLSNGGGFYGPRAYLSECERLGLVIRIPDVNHSGVDYGAEAMRYGGPCDAIRIGLGALKGLRGELVQRIVEQRASGPYCSLADFARRCRPHSGELEALILSGALDSLGLPRPQLLWEAREALGRRNVPVNSMAAPVGSDTQARNAHLEELAGAGSYHPPLDLQDYSWRRKLQLEQQYLGFIASVHPLKVVEELLAQRRFTRAADMTRMAGRAVEMAGWYVTGKRVDVARRPRGQRDPLVLQAAHYDGPDELSSMGLSSTDPAADGQGGAFGGGGASAVLASLAEERTDTAQDLGILSYPRSTPFHHYDITREAMVFLTLEDLSGTFEVTVFPDAYTKFAKLIREGGPFIVRGRVEEEFGVFTLNATHIDALLERGVMV